jgi:intraflagellar transport protein 140
MVSCWNVDGRARPTSSFSNSSQHSYGITTIVWAPNGKRIITGDKKGTLCVWTVDARGTLSPLRQYRKKGEICCAVFCTSMPSLSMPTGQRQTLSIGDARRAEAKAACPPFFFGTDRGSVVYADDQGFCSDVQQLSSSIDTMLFYEERARLIIVTRSLLLTQYQVADDGKVSRVMQVKLSVAGDVADKGLKNVVWASPGLLCMATQEKMVRLLDLAADESYNLSLSALGGIAERNDKVISVAFSPLNRYLAVGTQGGVIGIWRFTGPSRDVSGSRSVTIPTSADDWELHYKTSLPSPVHELCWHAGQGCAAAVTDDGAVILSETIMQSSMCGDLYVIQKSSHEVVIHVGIGKDRQSWIEHTGMIVRGLAVGASCFVVWNGKNARTYSVDIQLLKSHANEQFECNGTSMCIADSSLIVDEAIFVCDGPIVKILNFRGTQKGTITFSDGDGHPEVLDLNGQYLGVLTSKGIVKFYDVHAPTKPKALGSAGTFEAVSEIIPSNNKENVKDKDKKKEKNNNKNQTGGSSGNSNSNGNGNVNVNSSSDNKTSSARSIRINADGTRLAILVDHVEGILQVRRPHSSLHVFDRNRGSVSTFDFTPFKRCPSNIFWDTTDDRMLAVEASKNRSHMHVIPSSSEGGESGIDNVNTVEDTLQAAVEGETDVADIEVFLFFATTEQGLLMQDSFPRKTPYGKMLGLNVPRLYFRDTGIEQDEDENNNNDNNGNNGNSNSNYDSKHDDDDKLSTKVYSKVMRDFVGLDVEEITEDIRNALLNFSYNLTLGKLDEAYRSVKSIDSPAIWENMAQMCVKTKRLDVAEVCLGNMGHARGAAAVRLSKNNGDSLEATVGVLAIQCGLLDDAARLFREAERWDKLNKLYQSAGVWDKAIKVATTHDRIHLKNTHHFYAKHLESINEIDDAIENYELAGTSTTEVPRMLFHLNKLDDLEDYVHKSSDSTLMKWWGKYLESNERYDKAKKYYSKAGDYLSLVRIACFKNDFDKAAEIVLETGDSAAAYHLGRQLENRGEHQEAINYYAKSGCYNHSIRLAKSYGLDSELMKYALKSTTTKTLMLECGDYFENRNEPDKAIQLYHKGGDLNRALDLCFKAGQEGSVLGMNKKAAVNSNAAVFDMMNAIVNDLGTDSSPEILQKCAEFLVMHKQYDRAVELFVMAKKYIEAIEMCLANRVNITEDMVAMLTPPEKPVAVVNNNDDDDDSNSNSNVVAVSSSSSSKEENKEISYMDPNARKEILKDIAKALKIQGSFILASKKYTQAGDRVRAIKCLVRGGDTKSVIQFASISRNPEIYKLAANYLQQMNWRESVDIMKAIIQFYTKAKSFEQLAGFYDSCAQVEIDDYRDYEKAVGAIKEGLKHLGKANTRSSADMSSRFEQRIILIEKFVQVRKTAQKDPDTMVTICEGLLQEPMLEEAIRAGDCLAMLVEHYHSRGKMREAFACLNDFDTRRINPAPYVDAEILDNIYKAVGQKPKRQEQQQQQQQNHQQIDDDDDEVEIPPSPVYAKKSNQHQQQHRSPKMTHNNHNDDEIDEDIAEELDEEIEEGSPQHHHRGGGGQYGHK